MKSENFYVVHGWMVKHLNLSGTDRDIYAIIYGFCQDGNSKFTGSLKYLQEWLGVSRSTIMRSLKSLEDRGLLSKDIVTVQGVSFNHYRANVTYVQNETGGVKLTPGGCQNETGGGVKLKPYNIVLKERDNIGSCDNDAFFDDVFLFDQAPKEVSDRIAKEALSYGIEGGALGDFAEYINGMHFKIRPKGRIRGLKEIVKNFKRAS